MEQSNKGSLKNTFFALSAILFSDDNNDRHGKSQTRKMMLSPDEFSAFAKNISVELEIIDTSPHTLPASSSQKRGRPKV